MTGIDLSKDDSVIHLARCVLQTIQCEWEGCTITLNSWDTLKKHLLRHCTRVTPQDGVYLCSFSRCAGRNHGSLDGLKTHVELSHLSRVPLSCPAHGCGDIFIRLQQLQSHFKHMHHKLLVKHVAVDDIAPLAILAPPQHLRPPSQLPSKALLSSFMAFVSLPSIHPQYSRTSSSQLSRKWSRLNARDDESDDNLIAFDNLSSRSSFNDMISPQTVDIEVRKKQSLAPQPLLSRPQPPCYPSVRSDGPRQSILYPAFVQMVDNLVASGTLVARKDGI